MVGLHQLCPFVPRPFPSVIILVIKQIGLPLRGRPILLITRMITDRIGLHSVLLPLLITQKKFSDVDAYSFECALAFVNNFVNNTPILVEEKLYARDAGFFG